jgi:hypothetical protein
MSGYGLWFSRFSAGGEALLPLVAFGCSAWMFLDAATLPGPPAPTPAQATTPEPARTERDGSGFEAAQAAGVAAR